MRISCPSCDTAYNLPDSSVNSGGRKVKCATCGTKWQVSAANVSPVDPVLDSIATGFTDVPADWSPPGEKEASISTLKAKQAPEKAKATAVGSILDETPDVGIEINEDVKQKAQRARIKPMNPLLRTTDRRSLRSKLQEKRPEDFRALMRERILRPVIFGLACLFVISMIAFRESISRQVPDLASLYESVGLDVNLSGFEIRNVKSERVIESGGPVLIVSGEIENITGEIAQTPKLRFGLKTNTHEEIYAWEHDVSVPTIVPGGVARFQSRLAAPPTLGRNLTVRFSDGKAG